MFNEEKLLSALKNFTLQEMFSAAGQVTDHNLPSEDELSEISLQSAKELAPQPEMTFTATPYQPLKANFQSDSEPAPLPTQPKPIKVKVENF
jgi:hypothetical protein